MDDTVVTIKVDAVSFVTRRLSMVSRSGNCRPAMVADVATRLVAVADVVTRFTAVASVTVRVPAVATGAYRSAIVEAPTDSAPTASDVAVPEVITTAAAVPPKMIISPIVAASEYRAPNEATVVTMRLPTVSFVTLKFVNDTVSGNCRDRMVADVA